MDLCLMLTTFDFDKVIQSKIICLNLWHSRTFTTKCLTINYMQKINFKSHDAN